MSKPEILQGGFEIPTLLKFAVVAAAGALAVKFAPNVLDSDLVEDLLQNPGVY